MASMFIRPYGTRERLWSVTPAMNRWAIFGCPHGTETMDDNPYEAPQVASRVQHATKASRGRSVWLAGLCMLLAPLWIVLVIAMVVPNTTPSAARVLFLITGIIPAFLLFWFGGGLVSVGRRS